MNVNFAIPVDENAPVLEKQSIIIAASPEKAWQVLTAIDQWPSWQKNITYARLNGPAEAGTSFDWKAGGLSFKSQIHTSSKPSLFGWTGKTIGAKAIHNWTFSPCPEGTRVDVEECLYGFFPSLMKKKFREELKSGMKKSLEELKAECEKKS